MEVRWVQKYGDLGFTWDSEILRCVLTEDIFPLEPRLTCKKPELEITSQIEKERYGRQNPPGYSGGRAPPSGHLRGLCGYQCREAVWYLKPKKKKKVGFLKRNVFSPTYMFPQPHVVKDIIEEWLHLEEFFFKVTHSADSHWRLNHYGAGGKIGRLPWNPKTPWPNTSSIPPRWLISLKWTRVPTGWWLRAPESRFFSFCRN